MKNPYLIVAGAAACCLAALLFFLSPSDTDFTGQHRIHYHEDVAYHYCRALEEEIGIQIFYLPEWTEQEDGLLHYSDFDGFELDRAYFQAVLAELETMRAAYALYPDGFLKEMVEKKGERRAEIVLCPYTYDGYSSYGLYVHDYSSGQEKTDCIYYTGAGDSQYYSHEMGHMVLTAAAIHSGWRDFCDAWDACGSGYVSDYARTGRPEDWAETWAWLWHQPDVMAEQCQSSEALMAKVRCMSGLLEETYGTLAGQLPWASLLA